MKIKFNYLVLAVLGIILFTACNDDDGYSLNKFWIAVATVENPNEESAFIFTLDNGDRMWTAFSNFPYYRPADGQRILADYTILSDKEEGSAYDHDVKLNNYYSILTKGIFEITPETQDSIGHDPVAVKNIWIGSDYLNVEFAYYGGNRTHYINLVSDDLKTYDDGKVHLEFRHNANGDSHTVPLWGMASFKLKPLQSEGVESLPIVIHWKSFDTLAEKEIELEYKFNYTTAESVLLTIENEAGEIK